MKDLMELNKAARLTVILMALLAVAGCGAGNPTPEGAVKACLDKGWAPHYFSNAGHTKFDCIPPGGDS